MIILIVLAAFAVMAGAAIAGTGKLGEWKEPVNDSSKGYMPKPPVDKAFFAALDTPRAVFGYAPEEVDEVYRALADGALPAEDPSFRIVSNGYNMAFVDEVLLLAVSTHAGRGPDPEPEPDHVDDEAQPPVDPAEAPSDDDPEPPAGEPEEPEDAVEATDEDTPPLNG